ncbi:MAG: sigma 54-interacting transcriptional regulator, partial [Desulfomonilaceae bacterium]
KGALGGAQGSKVGKFQLAERGTIFIDEIERMARPTQTKLLRLIQENEFEPLGSGLKVKVNVRIISASNSTLKDEVKKGDFRNDLLFCLNVVQIEIPPLRERREDIIPLTEYFLNYYYEKNRRHLRGFSPRAIDALLRYPWPGNINELKNLVEHSVILASGEYIQFQQIPESIRSYVHDPFSDKSGSNIGFGTTLREMEQRLIMITLEHNDGNRTRTAVDLGITRRTLQNKLKEYGIDHYDAE